MVFVVRYQPLSTGNFTSSGPVTADGRTGSGWPGGGTFSFGFLLINDGAVPLTINKVQVTGPNELLVPLKVEMAARRDAGAIGLGAPGLERFLQFSLGAPPQHQGGLAAGLDLPGTPVSSTPLLRTYATTQATSTRSRIKSAT